MIFDNIDVLNKTNWRKFHVKQQIGVVGMPLWDVTNLNIESRGYSVSIYNRTTSKTDEVMAYIQIKISSNISC